MAQNYTIDCFAASQVGLTSLQNMENNFECLRTLFSGSSAPADSTGGTPWFDTSKKILKIRNSTNGAWLGVLYGAAAYGLYMWIYSNSAGDGWVVDSGVADRVLAIKGGTQGYNVAGGSGGGTWTFSGITISTESTTHTHDVPSLTHVATTSILVNIGSTEQAFDYAIKTINDHSSTASGVANSGHAHPYTHDATWRPLALVGTMQYPNM